MHNPTTPLLVAPNIELILTALAHAFKTNTISDPSNTKWYMDTGATAHLTSQYDNISSLSSQVGFPWITVGNGAFIPSTAIGHASISASTPPLSLNNVLLCPKILKNLIYVRQFTTDNVCSVEFDRFGFVVKDLHTQIPLICCDSIIHYMQSLHHPRSHLCKLSSPCHHHLFCINNLVIQVTMFFVFLSASGFLKFSKIDIFLMSNRKIHTRTFFFFLYYCFFSFWNHSLWHLNFTGIQC